MGGHRISIFCVVIVHALERSGLDPATVIMVRLAQTNIVQDTSGRFSTLAACCWNQNRGIQQILSIHTCCQRLLTCVLCCWSFLQGTAACRLMHERHCSVLQGRRCAGIAPLAGPHFQN